MPEGAYWCPSCGKLNATVGVRLVFIGFVLVILIGFGVTKIYVSYLRGLESSLAQRWFERGNEALLKGYPSVAADDYRNAIGYAEGNRQYRLGLAEALLKEGRLAEARANLLTLWSQEPANAELNLDLAQVYVEQNKPELAIRYYRAAIDGVWASDPLQRRLDARMELVHYLMQRGDKARASAELIEIQAESPDDPAVSLKIGNLLLSLGENARAAKSFDAVLKQNEKDVGGLVGAGQAALAMGDYPKAVRLLTRADELTGSKPNSPEADELALAREAFDIDPYLRNLTITQRANRVAAAFDLAMERLRSCSSEQNIALSPEPAATAPKKSTTTLPSKQNGYVTSIVPQATAPNSLQLLYDSGTQKAPSATAPALRNNPDAMSPTMDFVFEVMRATENTCPPRNLRERALQLIAQHESAGQS
ncbi:MAG: tetratricopeptide repeat protein [Candidatus Korobacteraceae bacterium]